MGGEGNSSRTGVMVVRVEETRAPRRGWVVVRLAETTAPRTSVVVITVEEMTAPGQVWWSGWRKRQL